MELAFTVYALCGSDIENHVSWKWFCFILYFLLIKADNRFAMVVYRSPHLARSHYCQQLTLSICPDVCLCVTPLQIASSFLFLGAVEPFFGCHFSMWHSTKCCSSIFDLGPLMPKIYYPKFAQNRL